MSIQKKWAIIIGIFLPVLILSGMIWYISFTQDYTATGVKKSIATVTKSVDSYSMMEIEITMDPDDFQNMLDTATEETYTKADITINGEYFENVGIRPKGNSTLSQIASDSTTDRYSFKVKLDEYIDGQNYQGMSKIVLNNNMSDTTYLKEFMSYEIMEKIGVATPMHAFTNISINGEVWGLYLFVEPIEESFIERNYGTPEGNLYKPESDDMGGKNNREDLNPPIGGLPDFRANENTGNDAATQNDNVTRNNNTDPNADIVAKENSNQEENESTNNENQEENTITRDRMGGMGNQAEMNLAYTSDNIEDYSGITASAVFKQTNTDDFQKLLPFIKNMSTGENLENVMNVDEFTRYFAANTFLVNLDHYAGNMLHNYYLYENQGVFEILPWDYNLSFGTFGSSATGAINFPIDNPTTATLTDRPLINSWLQNDAYKQQYHKYLTEIVSYVESGAFEKTVKQMDSLISDYVKNDPTAFYTFDEYTEGIKNLIIFAEDRSKSIVAQLNGTQPSEETGTLETTLDISTLGSNGFGGKGGQGGGRGMMNNAAEATDTAETTTKNQTTEEAQATEGEAQLPEGIPADIGNLPQISGAENSVGMEGRPERPTQVEGNQPPNMGQGKGGFPANMSASNQEKSYTEWIFAAIVIAGIGMIFLLMRKFQRRRSM